MNPKRSPVVYLILATLLWAAFLAGAYWQIEQNPPSRDWQARDLLTLQGWFDPMAQNADKGRMYLHNGITLQSVHFADAQNGWAVGRSGTILATQNGGKSWQTQSSGNTEELRSVHFVDTQHGWAVGNGGTILATQNGGKTWQPQSSRSTLSLSSVHFADAQNGWAIGDNGAILATRNGGKSWQTQSSGNAEELRSVHFIDAQNGWAVGQSYIVLATHDGGNTWLRKNWTIFLARSLSSVHFVNAQHGWVVGHDEYGSGTIFTTRDGGSTWQTQSSGNTSLNALYGFFLSSVHFADAQNGWAVGDRGTILTTQNGGKSWLTQSSGNTEELRSVHFVDAQNGWAVGSGGTILATRDGGKSWLNQTPKPEQWREWSLGAVPFRLWPSPLLILFNVLALGFLCWTALRLQTAQQQSQSSGGLHDAPVRRAEQDRLNRLPLVRTLALLLRNRQTQPPLTIAVTAPWGVGKSSVLELLRRELCGHARCVYINPWHYPQDTQLLAALMTHIQQQAVPPPLSWANVKFRGNLLWLRVFKPHLRWALVAAGVLLFALWPASTDVAQAVHQLFAGSRWQYAEQNVLNTLAHVQAATPVWLAPWLGTGTRGLLGLLTLWWLWRAVWQRLHSFSPGLTQALRTSAQWGGKSMSLPDWSQHAGLRQQFAQDFTEIAQALSPTTPLVLLVDDLDRCEPQQVAQTLATLNFVFTHQAPCFAVLAMDKAYVEHAIGLAYKDMAQVMHAHAAKPELEFAQHYLRKLVQLELSLAPETGAHMLLEAQNTPDAAAPSACNTLSLLTHAYRNRLRALAQSWLPRMRLRQAALAILDRLKPSALRHWPAACGRAARTVGKSSTQVLSKLLLGLCQLLWRGLGHGGAWTVNGPGQRFGLGVLNMAFVLVCSYGLALLISALAAWVLPQLTPAQGLGKAPSPTPSASTPANAAASKPQQRDKATDTPEPRRDPQSRGGNAAVLPADANDAVALILSAEMLALGIFIALLALRGLTQVRDSDGFLQALAHWQTELDKTIQTPREWRRLSNTVRLLAMRVRAQQWQPPSIQLRSWWQGLWVRHVAWAQGQVVHGPIQPEPTPFVLTEGMAAELLLLRYLCGDGLLSRLKTACDAAAGRIPTAAAPVVNDKDAEVQHMNLGLEPIIYKYRSSQLDQLPDKIAATLRWSSLLSNSPYLQTFFTAWVEHPTEAQAALRQWLIWLHDLALTPAPDLRVTQAETSHQQAST